METLDRQSGSSLDPRGLIGRTYVGDQLILLHHKYISEGLMVSEKICKGFSHSKSIETRDPKGQD